MGFFFQGDEYVLKMIVVMVMVAQLRDYMKNLELYTFNG